jgi:hypothetical protein
MYTVNLKLKDGDLKGNQWKAMNVGRDGKMINEVCNNSGTYPMPETCPPWNISCHIILQSPAAVSTHEPMVRYMQRQRYIQSICKSI